MDAVNPTAIIILALLFLASAILHAIFEFLRRPKDDQ